MYIKRYFSVADIRTRVAVRQDEATASQHKTRLVRAPIKGVRDLYELLMQKEALENRLQQQGQHDIVRKANRSPSLRLRFGRRADPLLTGSPFSEHSSVESSIAEN
ncbi:short neuropeptide F-like isoform X1 [Cryptotermes secundus]|uniref:short neuropeptide F-like isoform X1 n=1 Tax=Cryptotermes secundus TaxID=105785 RepID=UPI001454C2AD|nr:short neuropeptide F-like isoform X1 [Cryptotermes secundus]